MDMFGRVDQVLNGGLSSDALFMTWPELAGAGGGLGMLVQRVGLDYSQNIRRIFELGPGLVPVGGGVYANGFVCDGPAPPVNCQWRTQPTYYIVSRPEGTMQVNRFVGVNVIAECFYRVYGSPCGSNVITMTGRAGCNAGAVDSPMLTWVMNGVVVNRYNADITAQESVIQEGFSAMFAGLNIWINGQDLPCFGAAGVGAVLGGVGGAAGGVGGAGVEAVVGGAAKGGTLTATPVASF